MALTWTAVWNVLQADGLTADRICACGGEVHPVAEASSQRTVALHRLVAGGVVVGRRGDIGEESGQLHVGSLERHGDHVPAGGHDSIDGSPDGNGSEGRQAVIGGANGIGVGPWSAGGSENAVHIDCASAIDDTPANG
jgi:hypothetical protein